MATTKTTKMDAQGRVILPPHIRKEMNLNPGQTVTVSLENGTIQIRPEEERCAFCGKGVHSKCIIGPNLTRICRSCAQAIASMVKEETA